MVSKEKTKGGGKPKGTGSGFPFGDCREMFEKMSECCGGESNIFDWWSMMGKMKDEKSGESKGE